MTSLATQVATGAAWMVLFRVADRLVGIVTSSVLARLLAPEHFGVIALASALVAVIESMTEVGLDLALIRDQRSDRRMYDTAWTLRILRAVALGVVFVVLAPGVSSFFGDDRLASLVPWLGFAGVLAAFENIGVIEFRRTLAFDREFRFLLWARCLSAPVAVAVALAWPSYWALLIGVISQRVARLVLSYVVHDYRPRLSLTASGELMRFSTWVAVESFLQGLGSRVPAFALGRFGNLAALAHFEIAHELAVTVTTELRAPIRRALFPGLARLAEDRASLRRGVVDSYGVMLLIGLPIPVAVGALASLIVPLWLGEAWRPTVPVVEVLAVFGVIQALAPSGHLVYVALNRPRITAAVAALRLTLLLPLVIWGVMQGGAAGAGWAVSGTAAVVTIADVLIVRRMLDVHLLDFAKAMVRPGLGAAAMFVAVRWLMASTTAGTVAWDLMRLVVLGALGVIVYATVVFGLWFVSRRPDSAEWQVLRILGEWRSRVSERRRRAPRRITEGAARSVIVLGTNEWDWMWQTRQYISAGLARRGCRVTYSTGLPFFAPDSPEWKGRGLSTERRVDSGVTIVKSGRWLVRSLRVRWWDRLAVTRHLNELTAAAGWEDAERRILYVYHPSFWPYVAALPDCLVVYHADDAFALFSRAEESDLTMESRLVERAAVVVASSESVARFLPGDGPRKARILPNAADVTRFAAGVDQPCPEDLAKIPHPRIGYIGSINQKVDLSLVAHVAAQRPSWHWVFIGPLLTDIGPHHVGGAEYLAGLAACRQRPNVHFLGLRDMQDVPRYAAHMDVNVMCYRTDPGGWWVAIYPLKLHEYLAVGRPVVSADLEAVRPFTSVLSIAVTVDEWISAIEQALDEEPSMVEARRTVARANTWDDRVDQLMGWLP